MLPFVYIFPLVGLIVWIINKILKGNKIAVLGPQGSGKTTFLNYLRGKENYYETNATGKERYEGFSFKLSSGKEITIKSGEDIGGGDLYRELYEDLIKKSDSVVFIFDINKYLSDEEYEKMTNARMQFVYEKFCSNFNEKEIPRRISIILSHSKNYKEDEAEFFKKIRELKKSKKDYSKILRNFHACDMTNPKDMENLKNNIFGK